MNDRPNAEPASPSGRVDVELKGQIEGVTYANDETGYTVARVRVPGFSDAITIVGNLLALSPGEVLHMEGVWEIHPKFGRQFRVFRSRPILPATLRGIERYLGSGLVKGIGPVMASRIVKKFGGKTLEVIDEQVEALAQVEGVGRKRVAIIKKAWAEQKEIREIMVFLQAHGVGLGLAAKIFKRYGQRAIAVVSKNPYILATDISGVGFPTADRIAEHLGFDKQAPARAAAGILYVLNRLVEEGHICYPYEGLVEKCREILKVDKETVLKGFGTVSLQREIVIEDINESMDAFEPNQKHVYVSRLHVSEKGIARFLIRLQKSPKAIDPIDAEKAAAWIRGRMKPPLTEQQVDAVKRAVTEKALIITGGPGTGKTTIIHAIIQIYRAKGIGIRLAAPTGRAAKRMTEATSHPAGTVHRLLEYSWHKGGFQRNENRPIEADVIILDEVSMMDTPLMYHLLKALPPGAALIMVGDANQLPSVGPGNVLRDIIRSGVLGVIELKEIFRQAQQSRIIGNAHRIHQGVFPEITDPPRGLGDFYFIEQDEPAQVLEIVLQLVTKRIPERFKMAPMADIQVLTPMHKGTLGTERLNMDLQKALNPAGEGISRGDRRFRVNDKVMQVKNNYEKEVFNGDIGRITAIDGERQEIVVTYDGRPVPYEALELDEIVLAYAISVHKSQGSEYPAVVLPLVVQHYMLLQRNLIYTAVTRGKRLVVIVGSKKALAMGIKNKDITKRYTFLSERLKQENSRDLPGNRGNPQSPGR